MLMRFDIRPNVTRWLNLRALGFGLLSPVLFLLAMSVPAYGTILNWCGGISGVLAMLLAAIAFWFNSYNIWLPPQWTGLLYRLAGYRHQP